VKYKDIVERFPESAGYPAYCKTRAAGSVSGTAPVAPETSQKGPRPPRVASRESSRYPPTPGRPAGRDASMRAGLAVVTLALASLVACEGRPKIGAPDKPQPRSGPSLIVLDLSAGVPEEETSSVLSIASRKGSFDELVLALAGLGSSKTLKGVFVRFGSAQIGFARAQEIAEGLEKIKASGKAVYCHADGFTNSSMYAALRGCSNIAISPAGEVRPSGSRPRSSTCTSSSPRSCTSRSTSCRSANTRAPRSR